MAHAVLLVLASAVGYWFAKRDTALSRPGGVKTFEEALLELRKEFDLGKESLAFVRDNFVRDIREGLGKNSLASLALIPTYVSNLPSGTEKGVAYSLDVGGSNLRALKVVLDGKGGITQTPLKKEIPEALQTGTAEGLFDFIADCLKELAGEDENVPLGYTFSFPIDQTSLNSGLLLRWTKNFTASGVINKDVVQLLHDAFKRKKVKLQVNALINDTVGTMLAGCYQEVNADCVLGAIVGTGSNCCYMEKTKNITKFSGSAEEYMILNLESGNFGSRLDRLGRDLPLTEFDVELDNQSKNKHQQILEKQISGMYLGEILRLILKKYIKSGLLFKDHQDKLNVPYALTTEEMSSIEGDDTAELTGTNDLLKKHGVTSSTLEERKFVKAAAHLVARRAAQLAATQFAAILQQIGKTDKEVVVAVDGSVIEKYPGFREVVEETLKSSFGLTKVRLTFAKDGSGNGAALASVAATVHH